MLAQEPDLKFVRARHFADKEVSTGRLLLDGNQVAHLRLRDNMPLHSLFRHAIKSRQSFVLPEMFSP